MITAKRVVGVNELEKAEVREAFVILKDFLSVEEE